MEAMWEDSSECLSFSAFNEKSIGFAAIQAENRRMALMKLGGKVKCDDFRVVEVGNIGYTTGVEVCEGLRGPTNQSINFCNRVTTIYRRGNTGWLVIHHHTDKYEGCGQLGTPVCTMRCMEPSCSCNVKGKMMKF